MDAKCCFTSQGQPVSGSRSAAMISRRREISLEGCIGMMLTFDDTCAWIGGAWPQLAHLSEPCQRRAGQHDIAERLGDRDEQQKAPERFTQHSGDDGERIADERHPAQKQAPAAIAMIPGRCTVERGRACRKPGTVAETLDSATEHPIHQRTEDLDDAS